jgi:hypothetical protein
MPELERIVRPKRDGRISFEIFVDGTVMTAYINGETAFSARMYEINGENVGFSVTGGKAEVTKAYIYTK